MSSIHRIGLPEPILYALTPRPMPVEETVQKPRRTYAEPEVEAPEPGAVFTPGRAETGDEHLLTELRMLAELHAAHQASGDSSQAA
jgi:hypothetical protein